MLITHTTRYISRLLLWPTLLITFSLTAIVWLMQALRFVDFIINRGLSVQDFLYLTMLILPSLLNIILPIALLISVVFIYHKLYAESELAVMQASGLSRWQLARSSLLICLLVMGITYLHTLYLLPTANRQFKDMREFLRDNYASVLLQEQVFNHPVEGMTVFIQQRMEGGKLQGILVHDNRNPVVTITMMADEATLLQTPSGPRFLLQNGIRQEKREGKLSWLNFDSYALDLSFYTKNSGVRDRSESELYLTELFSDNAIPTRQKQKLHAEGHQRLLWPWFSIALPLLAITILTGGQFNRRGMWQRLVMIGGVSLALVLGFYGIINALIKLPVLTPFAYLYVAALILYSVLTLTVSHRWRKAPPPRSPLKDVLEPAHI